MSVGLSCSVEVGELLDDVAVVVKMLPSGRTGSRRTLGGLDLDSGASSFPGVHHGSSPLSSSSSLLSVQDSAFLLVLDW